MVERTELEHLAADLGLPLACVEGAAPLLAEGATVPFLLRYRKERIAGLREDEAYALAAALRQRRAIEQRKAKTLQELETHGPLPQTARDEIAACAGLAELEDLRQRHRGKRRSRGFLARERGLEPLAQAILAQTPGAPPLEELAAPYVNPDKGVPDPAAALEGARHIIVEAVAAEPAVRRALRQLFLDTGVVRARVADGRAGKPSKYETYYDFAEPVTQIPPHRVQAIRRGEKEGWLRVSIEADRERALHLLREGRITAPATPAATVVETALADAYDRLLAPTLAAELRAELKRRADAEAVHVFAANLRGLLLQPPAGPLRTLGINPGPQGAWAFAIVDEHGKLLHHGLLAPRAPRANAGPPAPPPADTTAALPAQAASEAASAPAAPGAGPSTPPPEDPNAGPAASAGVPAPAANVGAPAPPAPAAEASAPAPPAPGATASAPELPPAPAASAEESPAGLRALLELHAVAAIAIGNSAAAREADQFVRDALKGMEGRRVLRARVNDAGAAIYANSRAAREEFPDLDAPTRAAVSIARRLQDPLAELAQVDPKAVGVGQYQHDVNQRSLQEHLRNVVESCVNLVGVDLNRAPAPLLAHVSGIGRATAREIVRYRTEHGPFRSRAQLKEVPGFTDKQFQLAAGFVRVTGGDQPLDATGIHPERYDLVARIAADAGTTPAALLGRRDAIEAIDFSRYAGGDVGEPTLADIRRELLHPGSDGRGVFRPVECHDSVTSLEDLKPGMALEGTVTNVTAFGAFVDIGLPEDGLVHVSHLSRRYVKDPSQVVAVGRVVSVKVLSVDLERRRIALSIKDALPPPPPKRKPRAAKPPTEKKPEQRQERRPERKPERKPQKAPAAPAPPKAPAEQKPKRDPFAKATPEDIARLVAHFARR
ncbi:MAG TPA: Tex-like N-terminal domain-containing protein [Planctomycetota bacterium]|nr:Tex-like N-terminal domain-containing protein [Planctomycetota bacterium]HRR82730.1 Tex-like N-terminal domain-containing protein [Planctomycetota bacterium]HRT97106.1 Tex-like N-terminal domain-containing protein [Planctomycetota bacterium]